MCPDTVRGMNEPVGTVTVERRFRGPNDSGNGGYVCGLVASYLDGAAEVTLRIPPPLETELSVVRDADDSVRVLDGDTLVAEGRSADVTLAAPDAVSFDVADAAGDRSPVRHAPDVHVFPECFTCGPKRSAGDGLRIMPGTLTADSDRPVADSWIPDESLPNADGVVNSEILWAALDCTSFFGGAAPKWDPESPPPAYVLGRLAAVVNRGPRIGERLVAMGWPLEEDGRKLHAGSAVVDETGACLGVARATWISIG